MRSAWRGCGDVLRIKRKVNHVFYTLEDDFELDYQQNIQKINHVHLLIQGSGNLSREVLV